MSDMTDTMSEAVAPTEEAPRRDIIFEEALEAILFAAGHPVSYATIARVLDMTPGKVKELVISYSLTYNRADMPRGVMLLTFPDACQLCTKEAYLPEIRDALGIRKSGSLSTSSMETLAIVAYNQPVTRIFVDTLRRADSSYAMNNLLDRGLIESVGRMDAPGRPMLYGTTKDFLRAFGLSDISELPATTEEIVNMFAKASNVADPEQMENAEQMEMTLPEEEAAREEPLQDSVADALAPAPTSVEEPSELPEDSLDEPSAEDDVYNDEPAVDVDPSAEDDPSAEN